MGVALWKLNDTYRSEKVSIKQNQLQTQLTALRSSLVSQISQLRNTLSSYTVQIDESKINWVQLKPFYALAVVQEDGTNRLTVNKLFLQSGSVADRWNSATLQQNLQAKVTGNPMLRVQTFKDSSGLVHLAMIVFDKEKRNNLPRSGVMVVGDISYFQRFFDLQRTSSITQVLLTNDKTVAAHTEYEYVGNLSDENKVSDKNFFIDRQELRGTNLNLLSYTSKQAYSNFDIPLPILGIILGLGFLMSGVLLFVAKPDYVSRSSSSGSSQKKSTEYDADEAIGLGLPNTAPAPMKSVTSPPPTVLQAEPRQAKPSAAPTVKPAALPQEIPLEFSREAQVVSIQVQACVQQAIFNIDRQLKSQGVTVGKEFASGETVVLDYPKFIKIFENVLLSVAQEISGLKKRIQLRSYDIDSLTVLEIQAPIQNFNLHAAILPELKAAHAEFSQVASSAGEAIFRFSFHRQEASAQAAAPAFNKPTPSAEMRFELDESDASGFKMPEMTPVNPIQNDLDIDALLSLDDEAGEPVSLTSTTPKMNIEKEMQPAKFKLDEKMSIVEDPEINITTTETEKADQTKVKIRRPEKG
ncbi:hypothetical protein CIK05_12715 [Bdellovibrio sp. qaytius]|nr:hypothetical protein CIK05_12715 [Bdellovibrio sp. qaytius]